jgi:type II secretion system-associated lipoprotein
MKKIILFVIILNILCARRLIKKDEMALINEYYSQNTYYLKQDVPFGPKEVIKKDTSVKIWIESTATILKVKVYNSNEDRESAIGKMVSYIINEDFKGKKFTVEYLDALIAEKLEQYDSKDLSKIKKPKK